ncbi:hypothetical protein [Wolbachia endosymbiont (group A) of Brachyopa scutellaris]
MSQKIVNRITGLVDYKELETNILSSDLTQKKWRERKEFFRVK